MVEKWMACEVSEGMFPGEKMVKIGAVGIPLSFFISGSESFFDGSENEILVNVLDCDQDEAIVQLPKETLEGWRVARVKTKHLSS